MQLQRFTASNTPAALAAVRVAYGDDAIILANRRIGDEVEIIATGSSADASSLAGLMAQNEDHPDSDVKVSISESATVEAEMPTAEPVDAGKPDIEKSTIQLSPPDQHKAVLEESEVSGLEPDNNLIELNDDIVESEMIESEAIELSPASRAANTASNQPSATDDSDVAVSIDQVPMASLEMIHEVLAVQQQQFDQRFRTLETNLWGSHSLNQSTHLRKLFALGIGAELAVRLVERVSDQVSVDDAIRQSLALLKSTLPIGHDKSLSEQGVTILSGPPGCGKTTAMMKLATQHVQQAGAHSIVIIGADRRRIGAFEELQAYGKLLGVPVVQAQDAKELDSLVGAFTHKQLVLIDHGVADGITGIDLLEADCYQQPKQGLRYLFVLPANIQAVTADELISRHRVNRQMQCVLTHLDTNARLGELFSALIRHHLPIAYWSDSHSVRTPLEKADASVLVATAVAMSRRVTATADDDWLQRLIQPSHQLFNHSFSDVTTSRNIQP